MRDAQLSNYRLCGLQIGEAGALVKGFGLIRVCPSSASPVGEPLYGFRHVVCRACV